MRSTEQINTAENQTPSISETKKRSSILPKELLIGLIIGISIFSLVLSFQSESVYFKELLIAEVIIGMALCLRILEKN